MHQSALRSPRSLAPTRFHHTPRQTPSLSLLRRLPPQRSPAARPALPHAPPLPHRAPAATGASSLTGLSVFHSRYLLSSVKNETARASLLQPLSHYSG